jgi:Sulfotransferase family
VRTRSGSEPPWRSQSSSAIRNLWHLDDLVAEDPDALIVHTHRDPLNVISSISALTNHLRRMASDETSVAECAVQSCEEIVVGLQRGMTLRDKLAADQIIDVQFTDFMRDPTPGSTPGSSANRSPPTKSATACRPNRSM